MRVAEEMRPGRRAIAIVNGYGGHNGGVMRTDENGNAFSPSSFSQDGEEVPVVDKDGMKAALLILQQMASRGFSFSLEKQLFRLCMDSVTARRLDLDNVACKKALSEVSVMIGQQLESIYGVEGWLPLEAWAEAGESVELVYESLRQLEKGRESEGEASTKEQQAQELVCVKVRELVAAPT